MNFEEYLVESGLRENTARQYVAYINRVCSDKGINVKDITLKNIDNILNDVEQDSRYIGTHGNSYVSALNKYKEYLLSLSSCRLIRTPRTGYDENGHIIKYADDVDDEEKIPKLCQYLENEYDIIRGFVHELFGDIVHEHRRIPVILSKETPTKSLEITSKQKARMIKFKFDLFGSNLSENKIKRIIDQSIVEFPIAGEYYSNNHEPYIVLYYRNFNTDDLDLYKAKIAQTLAHEYMHYIHEIIATSTFNSNETHTEDVKEAVADFFGVLYSINSHQNGDKKIEVAKDTYNSWIDYFGSSWVYANALWFFIKDNILDGFNQMYNYYVGNGYIEKLRAVVWESKDDMNDAYSTLIR